LCSVNSKEVLEEFRNWWPAEMAQLHGVSRSCSVSEGNDEVPELGRPLSAQIFIQGNFGTQITSLTP
jgi:hypothetical protein